MRKHLSHLTIALLTAAVGVACSGRSGAASNKTGGDRSDAATGANQNLSLAGCVEAAPGTNAFVLRNVAQQPQGQQRTDDAPLVPRGSWVRLVAGNEDLRNYLGKHVTVTGSVRDTGTNTIGTAGQSSPLPRAGEANGNAPQIAVTQIAASEGVCETR
jgi:hypothetical protein